MASLIERLLKQGPDRDKIRKEAEEATAKYEAEYGKVPEEAGLEDADFLPDQFTQVPTVDLTDPETGEVHSEKVLMGASPFLGKMSMPAKVPMQHERMWNKALEDSKNVPGAYEKLIQKGKALFSKELADAEKLSAKQTRRNIRDNREQKVRSNKQTAEAIDYGQTDKASAGIAGGDATFSTTTPATSAPVVKLRKK